METAVATPVPAAVQPGLFAYPPLSPSLFDVTAPNRDVQARYELHRALDFGGEAALAKWAREWGSSILESTAATITELQGEVDHLAGELDDERKRVLDTSPVTDELDELKACIDTAMSELEAMPDGIDDASHLADAAAQLKDGLAILTKARKELDAL